MGTSLVTGSILAFLHLDAPFGKDSLDCQVCIRRDWGEEKCGEGWEAGREGRKRQRGKEMKQGRRESHNLSPHTEGTLTPLRPLTGSP